MFNLEIKKNLDLKDKAYYWIGGVSAENSIPETDIHTLRVLNYIHPIIYLLISSVRALDIQFDNCLSS